MTSRAMAEAKERVRAGRLLALKLSAILDVVALWQGDIGFDGRAYRFDGSTQVASRNVGRDDDFAFYVFPVHGIGTRCRYDVGYLT